MGKFHVRVFGLRGRVVVYVLVIGLLLAVRGGIDWREVGERFLPSPRAADSLSLAGLDLAPRLIPRLVARYRQDYPDLSVSFQGGGTAHALEALINHRADAAFLIRPPSAEEQAAFAAADGDTALWFAVALGGIVLLRGADSAPDSLDVDALRDFLRTGGGIPGVDRLYVPDPNTGLWDAFLARLGPADAGPGKPASVTFLPDGDGVWQATQADPRSLGLASTLSLPDDAGGRNLSRVAVRARGGARAFLPEYEEIGYGDYPLLLHLYLACRSRSGVAGGMFMTHVTSARGQRQIERDGFLPAYRPLREVYLSTDPVGEASR